MGGGGGWGGGLSAADVEKYPKIDCHCKHVCVWGGVVCVYVFEKERERERENLCARG